MQRVDRPRLRRRLLRLREVSQKPELLFFSLGEFKLHVGALNDLCLCLGNGKKVSSKDRKIVQSYLDLRLPGSIAVAQLKPEYLDPQTGIWHAREKGIVGYCFVKYPRTKHPETLTVVKEPFRNQGVATRLRDYVLSRRRFAGHVVYSAVHISNPASFKSVLKSGFIVFDITKDGYIQLMKALPYVSKREKI